LNDRIAQMFRSALAGVAEEHRSRLPKAVAELHALFTTDRGKRDRKYLDRPHIVAAYEALYAPRNAAKIAHLVAETVPGDGPIRVLDLGSGPLVGVLGAACARSLGPSVAMDVSKGALRRGEALLERLGWGGSVRTVAGDLRRPWGLTERFDLVVLANVLNELGDPRRGGETRLRVVEQALSALDEGGVVLILEPATRVHGRALMRIRDELAGEVPIAAPCAGAEACPLLKRRGDWCHAERPAPRVAEVDKLARKAGIQPGPLKMSYLALGGQPPGAGLRVIGGMMRARGAEMRYACGPDGLVELKGRPLPPEVRGLDRCGWLAELPKGVSASPASGPPRRPRRPRGGARGGGDGGGRRRRPGGADRGRR
jgi:hypothetical protein